MGAWAAGNFDNDAALDMVEAVLDVARQEIIAFSESSRVQVEDIDSIAACVAIHLALRAQCRAGRPDADLAANLRTKMLRIYDEQIDELEPAPEYRVARRAVLEQTLLAYEQAAAAD